MYKKNNIFSCIAMIFVGVASLNGALNRGMDPGYLADTEFETPRRALVVHEFLPSTLSSDEKLAAFLQEKCEFSLERNSIEMRYDLWDDSAWQRFTQLLQEEVDFRKAIQLAWNTSLKKFELLKFLEAISLENSQKNTSEHSMLLRYILIQKYILLELA